MPTLDSIVSVQISKNTVNVTQAAFSVPLILGFHTRFPDDFRAYTGIDGMATDGFLTSDLEYKAAQAAFAQNPAPTNIIVGRRLTNVTQVIELTPTAVNGATYSVTLDGQTITFTADATATVAEITAGLHTAFGAASPTFTGRLTSVDGTTKLTYTAAAGKGFSYYASATNGALTKFQDVSTDAGIATELTRMRAASKAWYGIVLTQRSKAESLAAAAWNEANKRLLIVATNDWDVRTSSTTDLASAAQTAAYLRTAILWADRTGDYADAAWLGKMLPQVVGSADFIYKTLAGVTASNLDDTSAQFILAKKANYYITQNGVNITVPGSVSTGEWIDVVLGLDWTTARIQERVFQALASNPKVPFTDPGIQVIVAQIYSVLQEGADNGLYVQGGFSVTAPRAKDISATDKQNRVLPNIRFVAQLAGAIHIAQIVGTVTV